MTVSTDPVSTPVETVTTIKPSEAIRLGCLTYPVQTFGPDRRPGCVMDAMRVVYEAVDVDDSSDFDAALIAMWCPLGCVKEPDPLWAGTLSWPSDQGPYLPAHLNDEHRWTREHIADWLASCGL